MNPLRPFTLFCLSLLFCACADNDTPRETGAVAPADGTPQTITVYTWEDYLAEDALAAFTEATGVEVEVLAFETIDEMTDRLTSEPGRHDVIITDPAAADLAELKLVLELDHGRLSNFKHLDPKFLNLPSDPGNRFSAPYFWGSTLVAYNSRHIPDPRHSWNLLFDPRYRDRVMMYDEKGDTIPAVLLSLGHSASSNDPGHLEEVRLKLLKQVEEVNVRYGTDAEVREGLRSGEIWASIAYSGDAAWVQEDNPDIDFFIPEEGVFLWQDAFLIARDTGKPDLAHQFINFMLDPEITAISSNFFSYASANRAALPLLDEELRNDERIHLSPEKMATAAFLHSYSPIAEQHITQIMREVLRAADGNLRKVADLEK